MLILKSAGTGGQLSGILVLKALSSFPVLMVMGYFAERYVLRVLLTRFDYIREYMFLLMLGWCLGFAQVAHMLNLSYEIGAFIAGIVVAATQ